MAARKKAKRWPSSSRGSRRKSSSARGRVKRRKLEGRKVTGPPAGASRSSRKNPAGVAVRSFTSARGHLVSRQVQYLGYFNVGSSQATPYVHDFERTDVELWALRDGSLLLRSRSGARLWDDFIVPDSE